jgi:C1A family cysteine protease
MATQKTHGLGWLPDLPDSRDLMYSAPMLTTRSIPTSVDLRKKCPPVYDQGHLGSCTANALSAAFQFDLKKQKKPDFMPSRLFIYYNERVLIHTENSDSGAYIRDGIKSMDKQGVCMEKSWPYDIDKFTEKPPAKCYKDALKNQIQSYHRLTNVLNQLQACLAEGYPFVFGFTVFQSFMTAEVARTGKMPMPKPSEKVLGGHAVMAVGYDDIKRAFIVRNSWGKAWGDAGYFYMPYAYITDSGGAMISGPSEP